jgi:lipoprotein-anchoring transpeptidase ErfK/SrfK
MDAHVLSRPRVSSLIATAAACASLAVAPATAVADGLPTSGSSEPAGVFETLSNLRTLSRWAYPQAEVAARRSPSASSPVVGHLRFLTGDGQAEVTLALRSYTSASTTWILAPIPGRPNGLTGWVPAEALGEMQVTHEYLRVNRELLRATLYRDGRAIWRAPIGVGRVDLPTPAGEFYVTEKLLLGGNIYGPYALGTSAYAPTLGEWPGGGVVGIHGTDEPQLIPGRPSHGCIRLRNADITRLWQLIDVGTPIEIV